MAAMTMLVQAKTRNCIQVSQGSEVARVLGLFFAAFPSVFTGSSVGSRAAETLVPIRDASIVSCCLTHNTDSRATLSNKPFMAGLPEAVKPLVLYKRNGARMQTGCGFLEISQSLNERVKVPLGRHWLR